MTGSAGQKRVPTDYFAKTPFPLPPLAEQKRIVARVDELMKRCDVLAARQNERNERHTVLVSSCLHSLTSSFSPHPSSFPSILHPSSFSPHPSSFPSILHPSTFNLLLTTPASVTELRKTILQLAVQGKLAPQNINDEPAEVLIRTIHAEKEALVSEGLLKRAAPVKALADESVNIQPLQWKVAPLAALCVSVTDGDHIPPPKSDKGIPFLVISNVRWGGINFNRCRYVQKEYFEKLDWIRKPCAGDILYTLVGSYGIPVHVSGSQPFCVQRHIGILRPSKHVDRRYLAYALSSDAVLRQVSSIATGIAQKTVPLAGLRRIYIPVPPLAEQERIVAKVNELMALCDAMEAKLTQSRADAGNLAAAVVHRIHSLERDG